MSLKRRIVSLVPSLSETLAAWGLESDIVGCTQFCVEPKSLYKRAIIIGGTKDFNTDLILSLEPTHIIANQEENGVDRINKLSKYIPTLVSYPQAPADVPSMMRSMGKFLGCSELSEIAARSIEYAELKCLQVLAAKETSRKFLYLIWRNPYMIVGPDTYISRSLGYASLSNAYEGSQHYPCIDILKMKEMRPEVILLSTEPFPFRRRHAEELRSIWKDIPEIYLVNGRLFSWHGVSTSKLLSELGQLNSKLDGPLFNKI